MRVSLSQLRFPATWFLLQFLSHPQQILILILRAPIPTMWILYIPFLILLIWPCLLFVSWMRTTNRLFSYMLSITDVISPFVLIVYIRWSNFKILVKKSSAIYFGPGSKLGHRKGSFEIQYGYEKRNVEYEISIQRGLESICGFKIDLSYTSLEQMLLVLQVFITNSFFHKEILKMSYFPKNTISF